MTAVAKLGPTPRYCDLQAAFWADFVAQYERDGYRPRRPAHTTDGLELAIGNGYCLAPVLKHGCRLGFDTSMTAEDGDIVLAEFHSSVVDRILAQRQNDAQFMETYGSRRAELGRAIKLLRYFRDVPFLVTNDSMVPLNGGHYGAGAPLGPSKVLGVCCYTAERDHDLLPGVLPPVDTYGLNANAATDVTSFTTFGSNLFSPGSPYDDTVSITVPVPSVIQVVAHANSLSGVNSAWQCICGGTLGGNIVSSNVTFPTISASFAVAAGTYAVGTRASSTSGTGSIADHTTEITAVKV